MLMTKDAIEAGHARARQIAALHDDRGVERSARRDAGDLDVARRRERPVAAPGAGSAFTRCTSLPSARARRPSRAAIRWSRRPAARATTGRTSCRARTAVRRSARRTGPIQSAGIVTRRLRSAGVKLVEIRSMRSWPSIDSSNVKFSSGTRLRRRRVPICRRRNGAARSRARALAGARLRRRRASCRGRARAADRASPARA